MTRGREKAAGEMGSVALDRRWHLARTHVEVDTTELEFALMRTFESFGRWQAQCLASCLTGAVTLEASGPENAMLHVIRMNDRRKSIKELARLMNRDDIPNIQYSLRKLTAAGLIEKVPGSTNRDTRYRPTAAGRELTEGLVGTRRERLIAPSTNITDIEKQLKAATTAMSLLTGLYDHVSRVLAGH